MGRPEITRRSLLEGALAFGGVALLGACGTTPSAEVSPAGGKLDLVRKRGFVRVAFSNEPPYAMLAEDGFTVTGASPEIARAALKAGVGDVEIDGVLSEPASMIPSLLADRVDMITAGLAITKARCQEVLFSEPDVCDTISLVVEAGNPLGLKAFGDVAASSGVRLGAVPGSTEEKFALEAGVGPGQIVAIDEPITGIDALRSGRIDALCLPTISASQLLRTIGGTDLALTEPLRDVSLGCAGAAFRKQDVDFRDAYNEGLAQIKSSGEFKTIVESFGFDAQSAIDATTEELCSIE